MKKGFTLVELLAVIVILAIILAIAIPGISNIINSSTRGAAESDAKMLLDAVRIKQLEDSNLDLTTINETNVESLLGVSANNYERLTIKKMNGKIYVTIVGKNKWNNLTISGTTSSTKVSDTVVNFVRGANAPQLVTGMTPIKWNGSAWVDTTSDDTAWYNYDTTNKIWANARTADGSMWVWIPRYIYRIPTANWHTATTGTVYIQFTKGVDDNWNKSVIGNIDLGETSNASNNKWTNHPAFTFGDTELTGIWVAKFEASDGGSGKYKIVPNVAGIGANVNDHFNKSRSMETDNTYGWGTSGSGIDTHMMKNIEWGAIAYLAYSVYGKNAEIWANPANPWTTGCAGDSVDSSATTGCLRTYDTANGQQASTTGNIYGIYDMSAGNDESIAAYVNNGNTNLMAYGASLISADAKYKDVYSIATTDNSINNFNLSISKKGDGIYEVKSGVSGISGWYDDCGYMPSSATPWLIRGGAYYGGKGMLLIWDSYGSSRGSRPVLAIGSGL